MGVFVGSIGDSTIIGGFNSVGGFKTGVIESFKTGFMGSTIVGIVGSFVPFATQRTSKNVCVNIYFSREDRSKGKGPLELLDPSL
jgi:hypothetical protein